MTTDTVAVPATALNQLAAGSEAVITEIRGDHGMIRRLLALGLRVGSRVRLVQRRDKGVVVACSGNRVALGASIAEKLYTQPLGEN